MSGMPQTYGFTGVKKGYATPSIVYSSPQVLAFQTNNGDVVSYAIWGHDNAEPNFQYIISSQNETLPGVFEYWANVLVGDDLIFYKKEVQNNKLVKVPLSEEDYPELYDWLESSGAYEFYIKCAKDYVKFGNFFGQFLYSADDSQINKFYHTDPISTRLLQMNTRGVIEGIFINVAFRGIAPDDGNIIWVDNGKIKEKRNVVSNSSVIKFFDPNRKPVRHRAAWHGKLQTAGRVYYGTPIWWSENARKWYELATKIIDQKIKFVDDVKDIKFMYELNQAWIDKKFPDLSDPNKEREAVQAFIDEVNTNYKNKKNLWTSFTFNERTNQFVPNIKVTQFKPDSRDDILNSAHDQVSSQIVTMTNTNPILADMPTYGDFGGNSGSNTREQWNLQSKVKTRLAKQTLIKPIKAAMRYTFKNMKDINRIHIGFMDFERTTLDINQSGTNDIIA